MIKINLLPYRDIQKKEKIWFQILLMVGVVVLAFIVTGVVHWRVIAYEKSLLADRESINDEIAQLDKKIGQIDKIKSQKSDIERKLAVIEMLNNRRIYATEFLFKIATAVPDKVWLLSIEDKEKEVVLTGEAELASYVSDFMERLNTTGLFQKVTLISLDQQLRGDQKVMKFVLNNTKADYGTKPKN